MKSWKDQLRDLKNALRRSERDKERSEEAPKLDFEPPPAWLAGGQPTPKKPSARNPVQKSVRHLNFFFFPISKRNCKFCALFPERKIG